MMMKTSTFLTLGVALLALTGCSEKEDPAAGLSAPQKMAMGKSPTKEGGKPLAIGDAWVSEDVKMKGVDGKMHTISGEAGRKGTLVIFTCNHCPYAQAWEERVAEIGNDVAKKGLGVIAINPNDPKAYPEDGFSEMKKRSEKLGLSFPYVVDDTSDVARAFGASKTPEAYLFDAEHELVYHGAIDDSADAPDKVEDHYLIDATDALLEGDELERTETKAVGCSIKFRS